MFFVVCLFCCCCCCWFELVFHTNKGDHNCVKLRVLCCKSVHLYKKKQKTKTTFSMYHSFKPQLKRQDYMKQKG